MTGRAHRAPLTLVGGTAAPSGRAPCASRAGYRAGRPALRFAALSRGGPRNPCNQDRHLVVESRALFAIFDGMGGHRGGELASAMASDSVAAAAQGGLSDAALTNALSAANHRLYVYGQSRAEYRGMGTTVALLRLAANGSATLLHAGDCRVYRLRDYRLRALTRDHNGADADLGRATAVRHATRGVTRALGVKPQVRAELTHADWRGGDTWLLTSDGITDVLPDYLLTNLLVEDAPPLAIAQRLLDAAVEAGTSDDATAVVVTLLGDREE